MRCFEQPNRYWFHLLSGPATDATIQSAQFTRAAGGPVANTEKIHFKGRYLGIRERDDWEYTFRTNASGVVVLVPVTDAGEIVLVEQYRIPVQSAVIELPAGLVGDTSDEDEDIEHAARRELLEETGYEAESMIELLTCPSTPGLADEIVTIYFAGGLKKTGPGGGDSSEDIIVHLVPLESAVEWLEEIMSTGVLVDPKIYAGLFWADLHS